MRLKIIAMMMTLLMLTSSLLGCSVQRYRAEIYSYVNDWLDPTFLATNNLNSTIYENHDYNENEPLGPDNKMHYTDPTAPETRTFIIADEETFNAAFTENTLEVDFETEMILLYMFGSSQPKNSNYYRIDKIKVEEEAVTACFEKDGADQGKDAVSRYHRCIAVKMKKWRLLT